MQQDPIMHAELAFDAALISLKSRERESLVKQHQSHEEIIQSLKAFEDKLRVGKHAEVLDELSAKIKQLKPLMLLEACIDDAR